MWGYIEQMANEALDKYKTTLEDDLDMLDEFEKSNEKQNCDDLNRLNCIMYRKQEKAYLYFLKVCSNRFRDIIELSKSQALEQIESWNYLDENAKIYFRGVAEKFCQ